MDHEGGLRLRVLEPGEDARPAALEAVGGGAHTLGIAGGEGSVAAVAGVPLEHEVPLGTLNHFARDLGFDLAHPLSALEAFDSGREQRVDVGHVNGRPFINNVSLGLYAQMLADPGYRQDKLGVAQAKIKAAFSDPELWRALRIDPPEEEPPEGVLAVVLSNNPYELSPSFSLGQRHRLNVGTLQVLVLGADTLEELDRLLEGTLRGAIEFRPALRNWTSEHLEMGVLGESVRVGVDGEPITLEAPLASRSSPVHSAGRRED